MHCAASTTDECWDWRIGAAVSIVLLIATLGQGTFQQVEEVLLLPSEELGQTTPVEVGWPFVVLVTEAYSLRFWWSAGKLPVWSYLFADLLIISIVIFATTRQLTRLARRTRARVSIAVLLAGISTFAGDLALRIDFYWYQYGVGALSWTLFRFVEALLLLFIALTWHYIITSLGPRFARILKRGKTQAA